jgi:isopentenyldiphosphate isomerase
MPRDCQDEVFDVVNERDEVIGQLPRGEVHRRGLKHRSVHILVFNPAGQVFLQKRSPAKDSFPGCWDSSASGHLNHGEGYDACAMREVREELGLELPAVPTRLFFVEACVETGQEFVWVYRARAAGPFVLDPDEIECGAWFDAGAVSRWIRERPGEFGSGFVRIWSHLETVKS